MFRHRTRRTQTPRYLQPTDFMPPPKPWPRPVVLLAYAVLAGAAGYLFAEPLAALAAWFEP